MSDEEPPLTPDQPTAQQWAEEELSRGIYRSSNNNTNLFGEWWDDFIERLFSTPNGSVPIGWIIVGVVAAVLVALVGYYLAGPARRQRQSAETDSARILDDDPRTTDELREASGRAAAVDDWNLAFLERFRAIIRGYEQRRVIDDRPGRTAYEAARDSGTSLPAYAQPLLTASRQFDAVFYGHQDAREKDYLDAVELDHATRDAKANVAGYL